jgi:hypothetical protein
MEACGPSGWINDIRTTNRVDGATRHTLQTTVTKGNDLTDQAEQTADDQPLPDIILRRFV